MHKLLVICGPTATGKTQLALTLASTFGGELVSADSRQVYNGLDALTGKDRPTHGDERIWMYDVASLTKLFSVSLYQRLAQKIINDIERRKKLPIVVGGTGLYIKALTHPLSQIHIPPNVMLRKKFGNAPREVLQEELKRIDQYKWNSMNESDKDNPRRLIRAIEITQWRSSHPIDHETIRTPGDIFQIGLIAPLPLLEDRIQKRVMTRWDDAVREVQNTKEQPIAPILGFSAIQQFLQGTISKKDAIKTWVAEERAYAKRQMTWFKKQSGTHWFDITKETYIQDVLALVDSWYTNYA
ncbi:tRNA (adenosine(37)-N6)-dimethylallyltransferase MiaA [Candidatus Gottesmanbacteria bacterium]|nr:tRNA (adenosine(37)-N6)-dimethylallyltransferase MiaA [Candidatus Gottesmanbacteria bacterium]